MKVVEVAPLIRGILKENLTYFAPDQVAPGAIVAITLRHKKVPALVLEATPVSELKATLRRAPYALKKISGIRASNFFRPDFIIAARRAAEYFAASLGPTIKSLVPQAVLASVGEAGAHHATSRTGAETARPIIKIEKLILQDFVAERVAFYKSLVRSEFARGNSVFICAPTVAEVEYLAPALDKGIKNYVVALHADLPTKDLLARWTAATTVAHPVLVVGTPLFFSLPRSDWRVIAIDSENSSAYKSLVRPYLDFRLFAEFWAETIGAKFIVGDAVLRAETVWRAQKKDLLAALPPKRRFLSNVNQTIIEPKRLTGEEFRAIDPTLSQAIRRSSEVGDRTFIFVHRRGYASSVVCEDCGEVVVCPECRAPMVLHDRGAIKHSTGAPETAGAATKFFLACHHCRANSRDAAALVPEICSSCGSWRLKALGIGLERVVTELAALLPETTTLRLDGDSVNTSRQARQVVEKFYSTSGAILIGTELALGYLHEKLDNAVALAVDALFALPDFRIQEKIFALLLELRALATKQFVIQTRQPDRPIFKQVLAGDIVDFYRTELADREKFAYPPFQKLIKITRHGPRSAVLAEIHELASWLADYEPEVYSAFSAEAKGEHWRHILIRRDRERWPDEKLLEKLRTLPPTFAVNIEPETLL